MLKLNSARVLECVMGGAIVTTAPACVVGYSDKAVAGAGYDGDAKLTDLAGVAAVTVCAAPAAATNRHVDYLTLRNNDSVQQVFTLRYNESAALTTLIVATLAAGEMLGYTHAAGWYVTTADGSRKSGAQDLSAYATNAGVAAGYQPLDSDLSAIAALSTTAFGRALLELADAAGLRAAAALSNVDNTSDVNKPVSAAQALADAAILSAAEGYADGLVVGLVDDRGNFNASGNAFPTTGGSGAAGAILKGDLWTVSVAGTLGGHVVTAGDLIRALVDTPGSTDANWAITENNLGYVAENAANKNSTGGYAGLTLFKLNLLNALGTVTSWFTTAATAARTWTMPDKDGTVAMTSDITGTNSGTNTGDETGSRVATLLHAASVKSAIVDADEVTGLDSANSFGLIRTTWTSVKAFLKTYFDTLYQAVGNYLKYDTTATVSVGYNVTAFSAGTKSSGTFTPDPASGNYQYLTNGGAFTLAAPASDCGIALHVLNNASAGAITFSGFTVGSNVGDSLTTTNTSKFRIRIERINSVSTYSVQALQ